MPKEVFPNYRSKSEAMGNVQRIETLLVQMGVRQISKQFDDSGFPSGFQFAVEPAAGGNTLVFNLPVREKAVQQALCDRGLGWSDAQARRTAWRCLYDWVRGQMAQVMCGAVVTEEVFMPFMVVAPDRTLFEALRDTRFNVPALPAPKEKRS